MNIRLICIIFLLILFSCSCNHNPVKVPVRVKGIPEEAFWIGGSDGGNWYVVESVNDHGNNANIKVYNDKDGSLIAAKQFVLVCPVDNQTVISDLKEKIDGYDGERILLRSLNSKKACFLK